MRSKAWMRRNGVFRAARPECNDMLLCAPQMLAVAGVQAPQGGGAAAPGGSEPWLVQFYSQAGEHLRTMRVPAGAAGSGGGGVAGITWDRTGQRLALAADSALLLASVRRQHLWGWLASGTVVYAVARPDRPGESCVVFWDTGTNTRCVGFWGAAAWERSKRGLAAELNPRQPAGILTGPRGCACMLSCAAASAGRPATTSFPAPTLRRHLKFVRRLVGLAARGDFAVLATTGDGPSEHLLILCNAIGSPVDSR